MRRLAIPGADTRDPPRGLRHVDAPRLENKDRPEGRHFPGKTNVRSKGGGVTDNNSPEMRYFTCPGFTFQAFR